MKKLIKERGYIYYFDFYGEISFESLEELIQDAKEKGWNGLDTSEYEHTGTVYYYRNRLETDEEYEERLCNERKEKGTRRELYKKLKKEFEKEEKEIREKISNVYSKYISEPRSVVNVNYLMKELYETLDLPIGAIQYEFNSYSLVITVNNKQYTINL